MTSLGTCCVHRRSEHPRGATSPVQEHNTSPKTGRELPDKVWRCKKNDPNLLVTKINMPTEPHQVLKPNHALRAQIMAFRELGAGFGQAESLMVVTRCASCHADDWSRLASAKAEVT